MLYPNPVKNTINLTINTPQKEQLHWQLVDNTGRVIKNGQHELTSSGTALTIDAHDLKPGMYFMRIYGETLRQVIKLIKQ